MSSVQRDIISRLKNADSLRYSRLKPDPDLPNDLYNYHLKKLIASGLVEKLPDNTYRLSASGQRYVADVHHTSDQTDRLFKMNVLLIVSRTIDGKPHVLNQRRTSQPSFGIVGVPGGTILKSEPLLHGARRKLRQETGLTGTFELIGTERRIMYRDDRLFSDVFFPICYCSQAVGDPQTTEYGENVWVPLEEAIVNDSRPYDHIESIPIALRALQVGTLDSMRGFYREQIQRV